MNPTSVSDTSVATTTHDITEERKYVPPDANTHGAFRDSDIGSEWYYCRRCPAWAPTVEEINQQPCRPAQDQIGEQP